MAVYPATISVMQRLMVLCLAASLAGCGGGSEPAEPHCVTGAELTVGERASYSFNYSSGVLNVHGLTVEDLQSLVDREGDTETSFPIGGCNVTASSVPPPPPLDAEQRLLLHDSVLDPEARNGNPDAGGPTRGSLFPTEWRATGCVTGTLTVAGGSFPVDTCTYISPDGGHSFSKSFVRGAPRPLYGLVRYTATDDANNSVVVELTAWNGL